MHGNQSSSLVGVTCYEGTRKYLSRTHAIIIIASNRPFPANIAWQDEIFCPHGGLSPSIDSLDDIATLDR